jgi:hypothetical protein
MYSTYVQNNRDLHSSIVQKNNWNKHSVCTTNLAKTYIARLIWQKRRCHYFLISGELTFFDWGSIEWPVAFQLLLCSVGISKGGAFYTLSVVQLGPKCLFYSKKIKMQRPNQKPNQWSQSPCYLQHILQEISE